MIATKPRPKYLNLFQIRLPLPGWVSFLHRISGAVLFLLVIPVLLSFLQASLISEDGYARWRDALQNPLIKLIMLGFAWAFLHHTCAGIRFLLHDAHIGVTLEQARLSSKIVLAVSLALTLATGAWLW